METAKVFWSGRSQAVRLAKNLRFDTAEVRIRRHGNAVILEPVQQGWEWLDAMAAITEPPQQERLNRNALE